MPTFLFWVCVEGLTVELWVVRNSPRSACPVSQVPPGMHGLAWPQRLTPHDMAAVSARARTGLKLPELYLQGLVATGWVLGAERKSSQSLTCLHRAFPHSDCHFVYGCFFCILYTCPMPSKIRRRPVIPSNWNSRLVSQHALWVLALQAIPQFSRRAVQCFN